VKLSTESSSFFSPTTLTGLSAGVCNLSVHPFLSVLLQEENSVDAETWHVNGWLVILFKVYTDHINGVYPVLRWYLSENTAAFSDLFDIFGCWFSLWNKWSLQNVPRIILFPGNTKQCNPLSYIPVKIVPLCNYLLLPGTVKMMETFLSTILWKTFQLLRRILNDVINITTAPSRQCRFQSRELVKIG